MKNIFVICGRTWTPMDASDGEVWTISEDAYRSLSHGYQDDSKNVDYPNQLDKTQIIRKIPANQIDVRRKTSSLEDFFDDNKGG